ncbi:MAG: hypothetical protein UV59_C0022G0012 [Candidatus Gottesmanbacteria bacterium GW2011_GWA1_43_11]|uniref:Uncharacterized protein n=1 Tax=Candidatus Gottesmanbacteria bacterium GW2011_GWA1_43_11 TaxID=1618436 RepID=A0A0G1CFK2_9BACT|nr:MAG: hypothetical protein UV59_C0022G0012 [Candidatus Gottesmanbacteria bacterium GW2011_GWA1_43_11]
MLRTFYCHDTYQADPRLEDMYLATIADGAQRFGENRVSPIIIAELKRT